MMDDQNYVERRTWMPAFAITIQVLTTLLLWIRIASRFTGKSRFGLDDVLILVAWIVGIIQTVLVILATEKHGFDRHMWDTTPDMWANAARMIFSIQIAYFWAACFTKISVLLFYRRLASDSYSRFFKWTLLAGAAFLVIFTLTFQILLLFTCRPIAAAWLHWDPVYATTTDWSCMSIATQNDIAIVAASLSVFTDFYAVVLPASLLMRIRISTRQKVGLLLIFGLGFLLVGVGIARTIFLSRALANFSDIPWDTFPTLATGIAECNVAILCASAPSLRNFFGDFFRDVTNGYSGRCDNGVGGGSGGGVGSNSGSMGSQVGRFLRRKASRGGTLKNEWEMSEEVEQKG